MQAQNSDIAADNPASAATLPHIVIFLADDLGIDIAPCYASDSPMPFLASLCDQSLIFERVYTHPYCTPSRAALMTGRHTFRHGADDVRYTSLKLPLSEVTLPEQVRATSPYKVRFSGFGKWHLADDANGSHNNPNLQGFDHFEGTPRQHHTYDFFDYPWFVNGELAFEVVETYRSDFITERVLKDFNNHHSLAPQFYLVSYTNPHLPFHVPPGNDLAPAPNRGRLGQAPSDTLYMPNRRDERLDPYYVAMLQALDQSIEDIASRISVEARRPVMFIFLGDNGSAKEVYRGDSSGGYRAKASLYDGGIRVPLQVWWSMVGDQDRVTGRNSNLIHMVDLFPTLIDVYAGDTDNVSIDGRSFADGLQSGVQSTAREFIFVTRGNERIVPNSYGTVDAQGLKVLLRETERVNWPSIPDLKTEPIEIYNTEIDPGEVKNLVSSCDLNYSQILKHIDFIDAKLSSEPTYANKVNWDQEWYLKWLKDKLEPC